MNFLKYFLPVFILLGSCNFNPNDKVVPEWEMDILGPLVKQDLTIQDIAQLDSLHASKLLSLADFGIPSVGTVTIPSVPATTLGPYGITLTGAYASALFESGDLYYKITNGLEINVKSNTRIVIKDGATTILSDNISSNIAALTGSYTSPVTDLSGKTVSAALTLQIQNFSSNGSGGPVTINPSRRLTIDIYIKNVKVQSITIGASSSFSITDTSDFSINGSNIKSQSVSGLFNTYLTNSLPIGFKFQVYFMDATKTVKLDSLFDVSSTILPASGGIPSDTKFVTTLNNTKINNLNNASFARTVLKLSTPNTITIPNNLYMHMQIVGDLKLKLDN